MCIYIDDMVGGSGCATKTVGPASVLYMCYENVENIFRKTHVALHTETYYYNIFSREREPRDGKSVIIGTCLKLPCYDRTQ